MLWNLLNTNALIANNSPKEPRAIDLCAECLFRCIYVTFLSRGSKLLAAIFWSLLNLPLLWPSNRPTNPPACLYEATDGFGRVGQGRTA